MTLAFATGSPNSSVMRPPSTLPRGNAIDSLSSVCPSPSSIGVPDSDRPALSVLQRHESALAGGHRVAAGGQFLDLEAALRVGGGDTRLRARRETRCGPARGESACRCRRRRSVREGPPCPLAHRLAVGLRAGRTLPASSRAGALRALCAARARLARTRTRARSDDGATATRSVFTSASGTPGTRRTTEPILTI